MSESDDRDPTDGASPEDSEVKHPAVTEEEETEVEFNPFEELQDEFKPTGQKVVSLDGMPSVKAEDRDTDDDIPPLSTETLVCMGDFSRFVVRNTYGEIEQEYQVSEVEQAPNGKWYAKHMGGRREVHPLRPPCKHYIRQSGIGSGQVNVLYRLCAARRTTEGAFMTVRDTAVWACDMREPRDLESERKHLDMFDERKIREGASRVKHSIFGKS